MRKIDENNPIISKGECECVCAVGDDGAPEIRLYIMDADDMLAATTAPISGNPDMAGLVKIFEEKHDERMTIDYGDVFDGMEFLESVRSGCIIDYDGFMGVILIDGYSSNLGLAVGDEFRQGRFLVNDEMFERLCEEHDIQVVWHGR